MQTTTNRPARRLKNVALAAIPLLLAIGMTAYRAASEHKPHNAHQILAQQRTELMNQMTARLLREDDRIAKLGLKGPAATKELNAAFYSAQKDFYRVAASNYKVPYPNSSQSLSSSR